ncbi:MAG: amidohydrolase family protein [Janthinobacterium lividum]
MTLVMAAGLIQQVCSPGQSCPVPAGAIESPLAPDSTVMPALISAHVHLALLDAQGQFDSNAYTEPHVLAQLQQYEHYGITTVVSLGMNRDLVWSIRDQQRAGQVGGATLLTVGRGIGVPNGFPPNTATPDQVDRPATSAEARLDVDRAADHHADLIKIWIDSNHGKFPEMSDAVVHAVIAEAHARGLRVAAHVYALEDARRLVTEGVDILAHSVRDAPVDPAFIALLKSKGIWYIPTLTVDQSFFLFADQPELLNDPLLTAALPASQLAVLRSAAYRDKIESDPATVQHRQDFATASQNLKRLYDAGINIGFGTDSGATLARIPGYAEHQELALMVRAGLTPAEALACATAHNAAMLRLPTGVLKPGNRADLLIIQGDPTDDMNAINHIVAVYHAGVPATPLSAANP